VRDQLPPKPPGQVSAAILLGALLALGVGAGCRSAAPAPPVAAPASERSQPLKFKINREVTFEREGMALLLHNDRVDCPCSPEIEEGLGIAINAPIEVTFSTEGKLDPKDCRFFICGASQFVYNTLGYGANFADQVTFVAVDQTDQVARTGVMEPNVPNPISPPDDLPKSTTDHSKTTIGEVFRANLADIMTLPAVETDYVVYAALGPYRSNTLTVKVRKRK
jgi:hypothetical protein